MLSSNHSNNQCHFASSSKDLEFLNTITRENNRLANKNNSLPNKKVQVIDRRPPVDPLLIAAVTSGGLE